MARCSVSERAEYLVEKGTVRPLGRLPAKGGHSRKQWLRVQLPGGRPGAGGRAPTGTTAGWSNTGEKAAGGCCQRRCQPLEVRLAVCVGGGHQAPEAWGVEVESLGQILCLVLLARTHVQ